MTVKTMGYLMNGMKLTELEALAKEARKRAYHAACDQLQSLESPFDHWCATGSGDFDLYHYASKEPKAVAWRSRRAELTHCVDSLREPPNVRVEPDRCGAFFGVFALGVGVGAALLSLLHYFL
jgi:hypothetical protein